MTKPSRVRHESASGASPRVAEPSGTRIGLRALGELAVELAGERDPIPETDLRDGRGEKGIARRLSAELGEARSGQGLEPGGDARVGPMVVRPGGAGAQRQDRAVGERGGSVE